MDRVAVAIEISRLDAAAKFRLPCEAVKHLTHRHGKKVSNFLLRTPWKWAKV
ncbi:hypothetical protein [Phenylobacterium sp.]|uniref:hypothetical protein n=1 Tax=Phenylobacterium sp. TaxID=1871053 RepID=UPI0035B2E0FB